jgi:disulfide bond formation protein DsbB
MSSPPVPDPDAGWSYAFGAFLLTAVATLGSLFFSEIMKLPPCSLCWYQRIFMFPLAIVLLRGLLPYDPRVARYALPLALGGLGFAVWHTLLYIGVLPEAAAPCTQGVPCTQPTFTLAGVLSIPVLSLLAFAGVAGLLFIQRRRI